MASAGCADINQIIRELDATAAYQSRVVSEVRIVVPRDVRDITILYRVAGSRSQLINRARVSRYNRAFYGNTSDRFLFRTPHAPLTLHGGHDLFHVRMEDHYGHAWYVNGDGSR